MIDAFTFFVFIIKHMFLWWTSDDTIYSRVCKINSSVFNTAYSRCKIVITYYLSPYTQDAIVLQVLFKWMQCNQWAISSHYSVDVIDSQSSSRCIFGKWKVPRTRWWSLSCFNFLSLALIWYKNLNKIAFGRKYQKDVNSEKCMC